MADHLQVPDWETPQEPAKRSLFPTSNALRHLSRQLSYIATGSSKHSPYSTNYFEKEPEDAIGISLTCKEQVVKQPKPTILGQNRKKFIIICAFFLALIILIIGLAVGLTKKSLVPSLNSVKPSPSYSRLTFVL